MNRPCKDATRGTGKLTVPEPSGVVGKAGAQKFDGRENKGAPALGRVENKDAGLKGRSTVAGRVP